MFSRLTLIAFLCVVTPAGPAAAAWDDYQIIVWQNKTAAELAGLRRLGVTAGRVTADRTDSGPITPSPETNTLSKAGLRYYVENIATDFYSAYHRWQAGRSATELFDEARALHRADPAGLSAFQRHPSLSDASYLSRVQDRLTRHVRAYASGHPLYYSLGDETGTADLAAAWDFDFSQPSLQAMRVWLRERYGSLAALNVAWGSDWKDWNAVMPMTTDAALRRTDGNVAAWSDFKIWMDVAFARAVQAGTDAIHRADPDALSAIEGAQIPGWGGYDYGLLADTVDVMEIYDNGENVGIARSVNPGLVVLTTSFERGPDEQRRIWRELLLGGRGLILWDENSGLAQEDGRPGPRGAELAGQFAELRGGLAAQLIAGAPDVARAAILYSPASFRTQWLLDRQRTGDAWADRSAAREGEETPLRRAMRDAAGSLVRLGLPARWITDSAVAGGRLYASGLRVILLPHVIALSQPEIDALRAFASDGGLLIADDEPGRFDEQGRPRPGPALNGAVGLLAADAFSQGHLTGLSEQLTQFEVEPPVRILTGGGGLADDIEAWTLRDGDVRIVSLLRRSKETPTNRGERIVLNAGGTPYFYDLRHPGAPGHDVRMETTVSDLAPSIFAISPVPLPAVRLFGPEAIAAGRAIDLRVSLSGPSPAERHVVHVDVFDSHGREVADHAGNLVLTGGASIWRVPIALSDPTGVWTVRVSDRLSGSSASLQVRVGGP